MAEQERRTDLGDVKIADEVWALSLDWPRQKFLVLLV